MEAFAGPGLDAITLVGLLGDPDRRRVFAALVLGAASVEEIAATAGLSVPRAGNALARFTSAGLVESIGGRPHLLAEAFAIAARTARRAELSDRPESSSASSLDPVSAKVMNAFVRDGRIVRVPSARGKRVVLLDWLAQDFEIGRRYSESMVNLILGRRHPDPATWRRYLVDEDFLSREGGVYWRSGGSVTEAERES